MNRSSLVATFAAVIIASLTGCGKEPQRQPNAERAVTPRPAQPQPKPQPRVIVSRQHPTAAGMPPVVDWGMRETAFDALARMGRPALPALVRALHSQDDTNLRMQASWALARMGPDARDAVGDLIAALKDPNPTVRRNAVRALGQIGPEAGKAAPQLLEIARQAPPAKIERTEVRVLPPEDDNPPTSAPLKRKGP